MKANTETVQAIFEASPDTIMLLNEHGFLDCNPATLKMFLCSSRQEFIGRHPSEYSPQTQADGRKSREAADEKISTAYNTGSNIFEWIHQRSNGEAFPAEVQLILLKLKEGEVLQATVRDITERKQAEYELELKDMVFEHSITANSISDCAGNITHANNTFANFWGYESIDEVIGKPISGFLSFDNEAVEIISALSRTGKWEGEYTALKKDGSTFIAYGLATSIHNVLGENIGYQSAVLDVTERKQAEEALRQSEVRFRDLFEGSPDPCWIIDENNLFMLCNQAAADILGYGSIEELQATHPSKLSPEIQPDGRESFEKANAMMAAAHDKGIHRFEWMHQRKNGGCFPVEVTLAQLEIHGKKQLYCVWRDITERKDAEESLKNAESHSKGIIMNARDAFVSMDGSGTVTEWNPEAEHMFGFGREEAIGKKLSDTIIPEELRERHEAGLKQYLASGASTVLNKSIEIDALQKNGGSFPVELSIVPSVENDMVSFNAFIRDLTERNKNQKIILESAANLKSSLIGTIGAVSRAVEVRDPYTAGHQQRVSSLARTIAQEMGLDSHQVEGIKMGATIHDIGKIQVPSEILSKPSKLNDLEYSMIKAHAKVGYEILKDIEFPWPVANIAYQHHEHLDGSGYPQGLKGDEICIEAKIVAVADVVEAIASHRPYRAALGMEAALGEITAHRAEWYDPDVVDACLKIFEDKKFDFDEVRLKKV